ncbi:hypothetical protein BD289DRAFT_440124 [Coniella lustricola]|uniref:Golgi apparatus membrane protein TVP38 n=1 Tax=Coniella lustricola TaxID=2025994 RepID=A0A2T3A0V8_9PEZI|nr:hypothetical protein BD289DRAFT_440124 [Coniella lustricola]
MPVDYHSSAAGLSASPSRSDDSSPKRDRDSPLAPFRDDIEDDQHNHQDYDYDQDDQLRHDAPPSSAAAPWAARPSATVSSSSAAAAARRLSTPYSLHSRASTSHYPASNDIRGQAVAALRSALTAAQNLYNHASDLYASLSRTQQLLVLAASLVLFALTITVLIFSHRLFRLLEPIAVSWRALPGGWLIIWSLTFLVAFPPLIGYSTACTVAGFVYGFPLGWPIVASATVAGSAAAFVASRTVFSGYVDRLVGSDTRFVALGQVLRHDGLGVLVLVRFCPLPYSLSNGFLATVPSIQTASFALATACASPKLLVHVFIGSRLALLAGDDAGMSFGNKLLNYASMLIGATVGVSVGWFIYQRTMARAAELAREEEEAGGGGGGARDYADEEAGIMGAGVGAGGLGAQQDARLMNPEDAAALMVDDDDISLWDTAEDGGWGDEEEEDGGGAYRDEEEEEAVGFAGGAGKSRK